jgi:predicted MFS family arabinose efflux permease/nucleotide-binding universal stress UspA family protein
MAPNQHRSDPPTQAAPQAADGGSNPFRWQFVAPLLMGSALNPVNSSLIATALVPIAHAVNVSVGQTAILVSGLYLASAIAQPTAGKLAEEFGPRRVFVTGILLVLVGGLLGGFANNLTTLVVARVFIGIGTSTGYPSAMLIIRRRAEQAQMAEPPGGVLGGLQIAATVTAAVGLPIGGVLVDAWGWRTTFFINVPVTLIALVMAVTWLPRDARSEQSRSVREIGTRIDVVGFVAFGGTMSSLLVFLLSFPGPRWIALGLAVAFGLFLVFWELRASQPFIDVRLLASNLALTRTYLRFALTTLCVYTVLYGLTQWLEVARGFGSREAGLLLLPMSGLSALIVRPIAQRNLVRGPLVVGAVTCLFASLGVLVLTHGSPIYVVILVTLVFGITLGTTSIGNQTALYNQVDASEIGTAAGLLRTAAYLGSIGSSAIISIVFHSRVDDHGLHHIAIVMIAVSALAVLLTVTDRRLGGRRSARNNANTALAGPDDVSPSRRIVVGVGSSPMSRRALEWARYLAPSFDAGIDAVAVCDPADPMAQWVEGWNPEQEARAQLHDTVATVLGARPAVAVREIVRHGSPAAELADLSNGAALMVISGAGRSLTGLLGDSATETTGCPLLVIQRTTPPPPPH